MRNLSRINNWYNLEQARLDWEYIARKLTNAGRADLATKYAPEPGAGWRSIDKSIVAVCNEMNWPPVFKQYEADYDPNKVTP